MRQSSLLFNLPHHPILPLNQCLKVIISLRSDSLGVSVTISSNPARISWASALATRSICSFIQLHSLVVKAGALSGCVIIVLRKDTECLQPSEKLCLPPFIFKVNTNFTIHFMSKSFSVDYCCRLGVFISFISPPTVDTLSHCMNNPTSCFRNYKF